MEKKFSLKFLIITLAATLTISFILPFNHIYANTSTEVQSDACITFNKNAVEGTNIQYWYSYDEDIYFNRVDVGQNTYFVGYNLDTSFKISTSNRSNCHFDSNNYNFSNSKTLLGQTVNYYHGGTMSLSLMSSFIENFDAYNNPTNMTVEDVLSYVVPNDNQNIFSYSYSTKMEANMSYNSWTGPSDPFIITPSADVYVVGLGNSHVWFVSDVSFSISLVRGNNRYNYSSSAIQYLDETYYIYDYDGWSYSTNYTYGFNWINNSISNKYLALYTIPHSSGGNANQFGDLVDVGYYTKFVNNQQSSTNQLALNKDVITWNKYVDSVGNDITQSDYNVEIQAQVIEYEANTSSDLLNLVINDLALIGNPITIGDVAASQGIFEITWQQVANAINNGNILTNILSKIMPYSYENLWYKNGWYYRIRLYNEDVEYYSDWQTIYQLTSYDVQDSNDVINYYIVNDNSMPNQTINNIINNINTTNNTNNYWYIDETPIGSPDSNSTWLETLIESITYLLGKIIDAIAGIFSDIIEQIGNILYNLGINFVEIFNNLITNIVDLFGDIDLTGNDYTIPEEYTDDLNTYNTWTTGVFNIFFSSGLALFVLIPLLLMIVRLVL